MQQNVLLFFLKVYDAQEYEWEKECDAVIWTHHGLFCSGESFDSTFGLMHTIEKAAEILIKVLSVSPIKRQTITHENLEDIAKAFKVTLSQ